MLYFFDEEQSIKITVLGYEFSQYDNKYDANWLTIALEHSGEIAYKNQDSCLLTWELENIKNCLSSI